MKSRDKFDPRAEKCIFVGYPQGQKGWRVYSLRTHEFYTSRDVIFYEHIFPYIESQTNKIKEAPSQIFHDISESHEDESHENEMNVEERNGQEKKDSTQILGEMIQEGRTDERDETQQQSGFIDLPPRNRRPPGYLVDYHRPTISKNPSSKHPNQSHSSGNAYAITNFINDRCFSQRHQVYLAAISSIQEQKNYQEAATHPEWQKAMAAEIKALEDNKTWDVMLPPMGKKVVGCRWVYKVKYKASGEVEKYKVRLVAKGFTQIEGEDFNETFAPVANSSMSSFSCCSKGVGAPPNGCKQRIPTRGSRRRSIHASSRWIPSSQERNGLPSEKVLVWVETSFAELVLKTLSITHKLWDPRI